MAIGRCEDCNSINGHASYCPRWGKDAMTTPTPDKKDFLGGKTMKAIQLHGKIYIEEPDVRHAIQAALATNVARNDRIAQLERDLTAAQAQSIRDSMTIEHSRVDAYNLRLELAAAQEEITSLTANLSARNAEILEAQEARERAEQALNGALEENASLRQRYNPTPCSDERAEKYAANDELESMKRDRDSVLQSLAGMFERAQRAEALAESLKAEKEAAVAQERERCAKVCESLTSGEFWNPSPDDCAAAIRRGE